MRTYSRCFRSTMALGILALGLCLAPSAVRAQGFTTEDTQLRPDGTLVSPGGATARAGFTNIGTPQAPNIVGIVPIFVYRLPTLATGTTITSAVLSLNLVSLTTPGGINYNVDLYAFGFRSTANITSADFYVGPSDTSTGATLIQDNFVLRSNPTTSTPTGRYTTDTGGSASLAKFLNAQYAAGAVGGANGNVVLFRLTPDVVSSFNAGGYDFNTQDNPSTSGLRPTLTITTAATSNAPEPPSLALVSAIPLVGVVMAHRRKSKQERHPVQ